jgi:hypothetical protein
MRKVPILRREIGIGRRGDSICRAGLNSNGNGGGKCTDSEHRGGKKYST